MWVDIDSAKPLDKVQLAFHYYGCTEEVCLALSHEYVIELVEQDNGARTYGFNRGTKGKGGKVGQRQGPAGTLGREGAASLVIAVAPDHLVEKLLLLRTTLRSTGLTPVRWRS